MNAIGIIILLALAGEYLVERVASFLNRRTLGHPPPEEFADVVTAETWAASERYTRTRSLFDDVSSTVNLCILLAFWFAGGFNALNTLVLSWQLGALATGTAYIAILLLARSLLALPFSIYSTFVIEKRFGFNTTAGWTFVADRIKGLLLAIVIGGPLLVLVLAFFQYAGPAAWFYCWCAATLVMLVVQYVAPTWIMPLFNKFTPLEEGPLRRGILAYAGSVNFRVQNILVMDGSRRSAKANAFFTGFGSHKRIALFDTLLQRHSTGQLIAVLAHEIGHYKRKHVLKGIVIGIAHTGVMLFLLSLILHEPAMYRAFGMDGTPIYAGFIFFGMLFAPVEFFLGLALNAWSRRNEFEADRWAVETTRDPGELADALKILSVENLAHLTPHPLTVLLTYSHPPVLERIEAIREMANEQASNHKQIPMT